MLRDVHQFYAQITLISLQMIEESYCKHPRKMRDLCADGTLYCMNCNGDLSEDDIMSTKTPTIIKEKILIRRKLVKKYTKHKKKQSDIAKKLGVSLSTIEKDLAFLKISD